MLKKLLKILLAVIAASAAAVLTSIVVCLFALKVTEYDVELDGVDSPARIVCISDLHSRQFGRENARLLRKIAAQEPDAIFAVGDLISSDADDDDVSAMLTLLEKLNGIAPTYYSLGNHEAAYIKRTGDGLSSRAAKTGVTVLDEAYVEAEIAGNTLRIGGTLGHGFPFGRSWEEFEASDDYKFLKELENTGLPTVCLAHTPDTIVCNRAYDYWHTDLFVSGHTHGGVIRVPFVGGLYAPIQEWWPHYDMGHFILGEHIQIVISSGLAGYEFVPRIFNRPEICVMELT